MKLDRKRNSQSQSVKGEEENGGEVPTDSEVQADEITPRKRGRRGDSKMTAGPKSSKLGKSSPMSSNEEGETDEVAAEETTPAKRGRRGGSKMTAGPKSSKLGKSSPMSSNEEEETDEDKVPAEETKTTPGKKGKRAGSKTKPGPKSSKMKKSESQEVKESFSETEQLSSNEEEEETDEVPAEETKTTPVRKGKRGGSKMTPGPKSSKMKKSSQMSSNGVEENDEVPAEETTPIKKGKRGGSKKRPGPKSSKMKKSESQEMKESFSETDQLSINGEEEGQEVESETDGEVGTTPRKTGKKAGSTKMLRNGMGPAPGPKSSKLTKLRKSKEVKKAVREPAIPVRLSARMSSRKRNAKSKPPAEKVKDDKDVEFEVERILGSRLKLKKGRKVTEYLIKWKGFSAKSNSWEPKHNLNCKEAIRDFEKMQKEKETFEVESVVDFRINRKTKGKEYLIKWKNFDQKLNTWEPEENLDCKEAIKAFENEKKSFEVEAILGSRIKKGIKEFRVKWKGFDESDSTWEPEANLNCELLIRDFEETQDESDEDEDEEYEVEKLLEVRKVKGAREFHVKWKGYGEEDNTWEPEKNLSCKELIKAFDKKHGKK